MVRVTILMMHFLIIGKINRFVLIARKFFVFQVLFDV